MRRIGVLAAPTVLVAAAAWFVLGGSLARPPEVDAAAERHTVPVSRMDIGATVLATGVIRPRVGAEVEVGSRVSGVLRRLFVTVGDQVERDELLAELDPTEFEARLEQASAMLESARVDRDFTARQFDRARELIDGQVIAQTEFDEAERGLRAARARVREAEAAVRSAEIQLGYTSIRAPISGVVASVTTQVGETVAASFAAPTFVTIIDLDRLEVWAYVDETDIGRVEVGQRATFTVDTYLSTDFDAVVTAIQPQAEIQNNVVNYITLLEIGPTGTATLRPEMTATVSIALTTHEDVLAVPNEAVRRDGEGTHVLVMEAGAATRRRVRTGIRGRSHTEILEGLEEGDAIVLDETDD